MSDPFAFDSPPDEYAVMGNPITHSKSPLIHSLFAKQTGQNIRYRAIQVDPGGLNQAVGNFFALGGKGLNITVPFKAEAWQMASQLSDRARFAGAVNTLKILQNGQLLGDNTDGIGLVYDLMHHHGIRIEGKSLLLVGAGGAARGVIAPIVDQKPSQFIIANRTIDKAQELASHFSGKMEILAKNFVDLNKDRFDIVINATSASLGNEIPQLPESCVAQAEIAYDMMYGAKPTVFMQWAVQAGVKTASDGLGMLVEQAAESFLIWRGIRPDTAGVISVLRQQL